MDSTSKIWLGLGVVCATGAMASCTTTQSSDMATGMDHSTMAMTAGEGGEGGESASSADSVSSDAVYLGQLKFIRGHLLVGVELYQEGDAEASETHMKHPESEIYAALLPALSARNAPGFADQLSALAVAVENRQPESVVTAAFDELMTAVTQAENAVSPVTPRLLGDVIVDLVSTAAAEYDIAAADDLSVENGHEYQDSFGFMRIAYDVLDQLESMGADSGVTRSVREQMDSIMPAWSGVQPPARLHVAPSVIYGAASRIELTVSGL